MSWSPYDAPPPAPPLPAINDCPFCRRDDSYLNGGMQRNFVYCETCECHGPIGSTPRQAIELWNEATEESE